ncbi:MAG: Gfo/Idh/MocA family oxidoreductase [Bacteriovoracaceae bacterium]
MKNVAVLGAGRWGKNHIKCFNELGALEIVCDSNKELIKDTQKIYPNIRVTSNLSDVLNDSKITGVVIATPAESHFEIAKLCLESKKNVLVEKPLALKLDEAEKLIDLAKKNNLVLMVGHIMHYHDGFNKVKQLINDGEIGKIQMVQGLRVNMGTIRSEENVLWSFLPHDFSMLLTLLPFSKIKTISAVGSSLVNSKICDEVNVAVEFQDDVKAYIRGSWINPQKEQKLTVWGSNGIIEFDDRKPWNEKVKVYKGFLKWKNNLPSLEKVEGENVKLKEGEPLLTEAKAFIDSFTKNEKIASDGVEGLNVLKALTLAQKSLDSAGKAIAPEAIQKTNYFVHETAVVDKGAIVGEGSAIWHYSHISSNSKMGKNCKLGQNVFIAPGVEIGENVKIQNNISLYTGVICEDHVFLGPSMVFTNVTNPRSEVNRRDQYAKTIIRRGASVGANVTIVCGHELGEYCFIGAGAVVTKNVKPYALMVGNPARQLSWMSRFGIRLDLPLTSETEVTATCPESGEKYSLKGQTLTWLGK